MAKGILTRRGGGAAETTPQPRINFVSATGTSITFTITNNSIKTREVVYGLTTPPDTTTLTLNSLETSANQTITGLQSGVSYIIYAQAEDSIIIERTLQTVWEPIQATGGTITTRTIDNIEYQVHTFNYTGSDQNFIITQANSTNTNELYVKVFGAAGGGASTTGSGIQSIGGSGGFGIASFKDPSKFNTLKVVVGQGGRARTTSGVIGSTYGHFGLHSTGQVGGWGTCGGWGGGLSGVFNNTINQQNALVIAGGGGGAGINIDGTVRGRGGPGGGLNANGLNGNLDGSNRGSGRGGTLAGGGLSGLSFFVSPNGVASSSIAQPGIALSGGHGHTACSWTEGGGGGSGYFGGGSGAHGQPSWYWDPAGGGSGYANLSETDVVLSITSEPAVLNSNVSNDIDYSSGVSISNFGTSQAGNGKVVIYYPLTNPN